jgi:hypothetical protein
MIYRGRTGIELTYRLNNVFESMVRPSQPKYDQKEQKPSILLFETKYIGIGNRPCSNDWRIYYLSSIIYIYIYIYIFIYLFKLQMGFSGGSDLQ